MTQKHLHPSTTNKKVCIRAFACHTCTPWHRPPLQSPERSGAGGLVCVRCQCFERSDAKRLDFR